MHARVPLNRRILKRDDTERRWKERESRACVAYFGKTVGFQSSADRRALWFLIRMPFSRITSIASRSLFVNKYKRQCEFCFMQFVLNYTEPGRQKFII